MKIGIISDTHNMLRPEVRDILQSCELILHAGDVSKPEVLEEIRRIAPVKAVRGNNDRAWPEELPMYLDFELEGCRFFMMHRKTDIPKDLLHPEPKDILCPTDPEDMGGNADERCLTAFSTVVIFGHSHRYEMYREGSTLFLNPGSCGPRRFTRPITMMIMEINDGRICIRRVEIEHKKQMKTPLPSDTNQIIIGAVHDIEKGLSVSGIAYKYNISREFAEQICRMYLTHPGIDAQGVLNKMELRDRGL